MQRIKKIDSETEEEKSDKSIIDLLSSVLS